MPRASASTRVWRKTARAASNAGARRARRTSASRGVGHHALPGLRVREGHEAGRGQVALARVAQVQGDHVVPATQRAERLLVALGLEVGDDGDDAAPLHHPLGEAQRPGEVGAAADRLARQQVAHDAQRVVAAAARGHVALDAVGEEHRAHPVVVGHRREGEHRRELRGVVALEQVREPNCCEPETSTSEQQGEVALLDELLDVGRAHARGDVPVDRAHVVARAGTRAPRRTPCRAP